MSTPDPVNADLYGGCGGWTEGLNLLGLTDIGFEWMAEACATRAAAGHRTIRCDLATYPVQPCTTLIASPPCQTFSNAGTGDGREHLDRLAYQTEVGDWSTEGLDDRTSHVLTPGRWIDDSGCDTVLLEQVPGVLPVWQGYARLLRARGWSTWAGVLCAADYGVPQTRRRAFLIASRVREVTAPEPTHCEGGAVSLFGELAPWVSMAEALGWGLADRPGFTVPGHNNGGGPDGIGGSGARRALSEARDVGDWVVRTGNNMLDCREAWVLRPGGGEKPTVRHADEPAATLAFGHDAANWVWTRPATTIAGDSRVWPPGHKVNQDDRDRLGEAEADERYGDRAVTEAIRLTIEEALILQSFRPDLPLQGTKSARFLQVGNAVPPLMAAHVAAAALGLSAHPAIRG